jgi:hypothetical protein
VTKNDIQHRTHHLYRISFPDGRAYIGVAINPTHRFRRHCCSAETLIGDRIRHYGKDNISVSVLACGSREYIYDLEVRAIKAFGTLWPAGFNCSGGGLGGRNALPSTRAKLSAAKKGKPCPHRGTPWPESRKTALSAFNIARGIKPPSNKGKPRSPEHSAKISAGLRANPRSPEVTARCVAAAAAALRGKPPWNKGRRGDRWSAARRAAYEQQQGL